MYLPGWGCSGGRKLRLLARAFVWRDLQIGAVQLLAPALDDEIESNFILKHMGARRVHPRRRAEILSRHPGERRHACPEGGTAAANGR